MSDVTKLLSAIEEGDEKAADRLLPLVYQELRKLAAAKLSKEKPGQTLQPTVLVHEAYLRLVDVENPQQWNGRGHFFAAAAEAMRRILVERARRAASLKHGGQMSPQDIDPAHISSGRGSEILGVHNSVDDLAEADPLAAQLVKLRYFAGFTIAQSAELLSISPRTANNLWAYARAWLAVELGPD